MKVIVSFISKVNHLTTLEKKLRFFYNIFSLPLLLLLLLLFEPSVENDKLISLCVNSAKKKKNRIRIHARGCKVSIAFVDCLTILKKPLKYLGVLEILRPGVIVPEFLLLLRKTNFITNFFSVKKQIICDILVRIF